MKTKAVYRIGLLFLALTIALGFVGPSAAMWTNGMNLKGMVVTGNIDPVYTQTNVAVSGKGKVDVDIASTDGKVMLINASDIRSLTEINIDYTVTNRGSVPVRFSGSSSDGSDGSGDNSNDGCKNDWDSKDDCKGDCKDIGSNCSHPGVTVINNFPEGVIPGNNGTGTGKLTIRINRENNKPGRDKGRDAVCDGKTDHGPSGRCGGESDEDADQGQLSFELNMVFAQWNAVDNGNIKMILKKF